MGNYIAINNYSGLGNIGISRNSIASIVALSLREVQDVNLYGPHKKSRSKDTALGKLLAAKSGVRIVFTKEGKASIRLEVTLRHGVNVVDVCQKIQETVANALELMCDVVPFDVQVKVMRFA